MVSVVHPLAAEAGAEMLRRGGNAIDAAAAVQWALNVVEPSMSGLGGGTLILYWDNATKKVVYLDGRETAPRASTADQFLLPNGDRRSFDQAHTRGYAVGVPGTLRVFERAVRDHGRLNLSETFGPAIGIAESGFTVDAYLASYVQASEAKLRSWPASAKLFVPGSICPPDLPPVSGNAGCTGGAALKAGDRLQQKDLAATFRLLQSQGPDPFYRGAVGAAIVSAQAQREGRMVAADLASYEAKERAPVAGSFRGHGLVSSSPPSAGGLGLIEMLHILDPMDLGAEPLGPTPLHAIIEATHLAYADRFAYIGDTDHVFVPMRGLVDPRYAAERRALIQPGSANADVKPGDPWKYEGNRSGASEARERDQGGHTTHYTIVDAWGNVATVTSTLEHLFGTAMLVPGYGFFLNNQLTDFDFTPGGPNQVEPGKRPRSSMTPTLVFKDGEPVLALGSPGGPTITPTVLQAVVQFLVFGRSLEESVKAPRVYSAVYPAVDWEPSIPVASRDALKAKGHQLAAEADPTIGNVQAVARLADGSWRGVADSRAGAGSVVYVEAG